MRFLDIVRPFMVVLPEVSKPDRRVPFKEKAMWSAIVLALYLWCSQIPLYGIRSKDGADPFYW